MPLLGGFQIVCLYWFIHSSNLHLFRSIGYMPGTVSGTWGTYMESHIPALKRLIVWRRRKTQDKHNTVDNNWDKSLISCVLAACSVATILSTYHILSRWSLINNQPSKYNFFFSFTVQKLRQREVIYFIQYHTVYDKAGLWAQEI